MKAYIKERTLQVAKFIMDTEETIRETARVFNFSKSTVHNDVSKRLPKIDQDMFEHVKIVLDKNFAEKHIRGGESTKHKYEQERTK